MIRWIKSLTEGSLLRRTLLCVGTLVLGSLTFVTVTSFVLVSVAKEVFPSHTNEPALNKKVEAQGAEAPSPKLKPLRSPRAKPSLPSPPVAESDDGDNGE